MRPFEEAKHFSSLFRQKNREEQLKFVERIREIAIAILEPIRPPGYDLKNPDHAIIFCLESLHPPTPATIPFRDALSLLRACTSALESGNVDQRHIDWIKTSYAGLDERLTDGATDLAKRGKKGIEDLKKAREKRNAKLKSHRKIDKLIQKEKNSLLKKTPLLSKTRATQIIINKIKSEDDGKELVFKKIENMLEKSPEYKLNPNTIRRIKILPQKSRN